MTTQQAGPQSRPDPASEAAAGAGAGGRARGATLARLGGGLLALLALVALGRLAGGYIEPFTQWVDGLGFFGPVIFIAAYAVAVVAFVPASLLTLGAGAVFGVLRGTLYVFAAATLGSTLAFLVARYGARRAVERRLAADRRFAAIDRAVGAEGRKIVFLLRLSPVFPFNLLNYALGLTGVRLGDYVLASLGMIPGTLLYVYLGSLAREVASAASGTGRSPLELALFAVGLVATVLAAWVVVRSARRALDEATELPADPDPETQNADAETQNADAPAREAQP